jgi:hypothetical protein
LSGTLLDPRIGFTAEATDLSVDQAGADRQAHGLSEPIRGSGQYSATVTGTDWQIMPTADRPLAGRLDLYVMSAARSINPAAQVICRCATPSGTAGPW